MLKDSVKKFVALETMSCLRIILETQKVIKTSLMFKMKSFFNGELYVGDVDHGIGSILKQSYGYISAGLCLTNTASLIESSGFRVMPRFMPETSLHCCRVAVGLQPENTVLELDMWRFSNSVYLLHSKTGFYEKKNCMRPPENGPRLTTLLGGHPYCFIMAHTAL